MAIVNNTCPNCQRAVEPFAFQCPHCELLLEAASLDEIEIPSQPTLVRLMLAPPMARPSTATIAVPEEVRQAARKHTRPTTTAPTVVAATLMTTSDIPVVVASLDLTAFALSSFEAFVISMVDGRSNIETLRQLVGLTKPEIHAVLTTLVNRKVLAVQPGPPPPPKGGARGAAAASPATPPPPSGAPRPKPRALDPEVLFEDLTDPRRDLARRSKPISLEEPPRTNPAQASGRTSSQPAVPAAQPAPGTRQLQGGAHVQAFLEAVKDGRKMPAAPAPQAAVANPLQRAIELEQQGLLEEAMEVLEEAIAGSRAPAALYNRLAIVLLAQRRDLRRAESLLDKARRLEPDNTIYEQNYFRVVAMVAALHTGVRENPLHQPRRKT